MQCCRLCVTSPELSGTQPVPSEAANLDLPSSDALTGGSPEADLSQTDLGSVNCLHLCRKMF